PPPDLLLAPDRRRTGAAHSGFDRFYRYEAPRYSAAGTPPALPIPPEAIRRDPAVRGGSLARAGLDATAIDRLSADGFVVVAPGEGFAFDGSDAPCRFPAGDVPIYVTVDATLHLGLLLFDAVLAAVEERHLAPMLQRLAGALRREALGALALPGPAGKAALHNLAVLEVVRRLLDPSARIHPRVRRMVLGDMTTRRIIVGEVDLIERAAGRALSPVFGYMEDYAQYVPHGRYARSEAMSRYFRAATYLGRMAFLVRAKDDPAPSGVVDRDLARRSAAQSALLARWLQTIRVDGMMALHVWDRIHRAGAFFVGFADDPTPVEIAAASERAFGDEIWPLEAVADIAKIDKLRAEIAATRVPAILGSPAGTPGAAAETPAAEVGLRLMGRRHVPDADLMGRLVSSPPGDPAWRSNLHWGWMEVLREVAVPRAPSTQAFQTSRAWEDRLLASALASWAALRRGATPPATTTTTTTTKDGPELPAASAKGFVDPYPDVFARLRALGRTARAGLDDMGLLADVPGAAAALDGFDELLRGLEEIAVRQIEDRALRREDGEFLAGFPGRCGRLLDDIAGIGGDGAPPAGERVAADLGAAFAAQLLVAVVRAPGSTEPFVAAGPVLRR
ncbi:MAG: DUF3160 domain-containing protein, partial [Myxococcota bacterium]|nr:DUF3160 domain-containing protein [Myxococcota bacterium]